MRWSLRALALSALAVFAVSSAANAQYCVQTVRHLTDFTIRGDAWTWWASADGVHERGAEPEIGSIIVFDRQSDLPLGHVSVVSAIVDERTIEVDHTWASGDQIVYGAPVIDVSQDNDWSSVRVWHEPTETMGLTEFRISGFIYPEAPQTLFAGLAAHADTLVD
jgi:hypothetical protein